MKKRLLSVLLTVCMILTLLPVNAFAAENSYVADEFSDISSLNYDSGNDHTLAYAIWEKNDDFFVAVLAMQDVSSDDGEVVYTGDSLTVIHDKSQIQNLNAQETLKKFVDEKANKNTEWTVIQFSEDYVKKHATPDDTNEKVYIFTTDIDVQGDGHTFDNTIEVPKDFFEETGIIDPPDEPADEARTNHINIEVVLNGGTSAITSGYVDEYITVEPFQNETDGTYEDWNSGDYGNGTVTYSYTYYDCKDIGFEAKTGYVIEAIDADLVFGQSGCKGIYGITTADEKQYGEYMADNVQGGSTVTVYVRTAYTVEYYLDGEPLNYDPYNDNTLYVADTTDGLTESNGPAQNPSGSEYSRVDCNCADEGKDCPHDGLTDSEGGQPEADYLEVFDDLNKTIELPSLPGAESGGNVVFGWYESNDSTSERHDQNTSVNVADHMNRAENRVIKFYALETTPDDPELTVTKVLTSVNDEKYTGGTVEVGDKLIYAIEVANTGNVALTNITVTDIMNAAGPVDISLKNGDKESVTIDDVSDTVTIASLPAGEMVKLTVTYVVQEEDMGQEINNEVVAKVPGGPSDDDKTTGVTVNPLENPDLTVTKDLVYVNGNEYTSGAVNVGDTLTYAIEVANTGNVALTNITVTDIMNAAGPVDISLKSGDKESVTIDDVSDTVTIASLPAGEMVKLTVTYVVQEEDMGQEINNEVVAKVPGGPSDDDKTTGVTVNPLENPDLTVTKDLVYVNGNEYTSGAVNVGDTLTYAIEVANTGNVALTNITVTDIMNAAGPVDISLKSGDKESVTIDDVSDTVTIASLPAGEMVKLTVTYVVQEEDMGQEINNEVVAKVPGGPSDDDKTTGVTVNPLENPDLTVTKDLVYVNGNEYTSGAVNVGDTLTYAIEVANTGNVALTNITVTDIMNAAGPVDISLKNGDKESVTIDDVSDTVTIASLPAGEMVKLTVTYVVQEEDMGQEINNEVVAKVPGGPSDDDKTTGVTVNPLENPDLTVTKDLVYVNGNEYTSGAVNVGDTLTYAIEVANTGNVALTNITVTDIMNAAGPVDISLKSGDKESVTIDDVSDTVTIASLPAGEMVKLTVTYVVQEEDMGQEINNEVVAKVPGGPSDDDKTTGVTVNPLENPDLTVTKDLVYVNGNEYTSGAVNVGDTLTYAIEVANTGNVALTNITVTDIMNAAGPVDIFLKSGDKESVTIDDVSDTVTIASLPAGEMVKLTVTYVVQEEDMGQEINNEVAAEVPGGPSDYDKTTGVTVNNPDIGISKSVTGMTGENGTAVEGDELTYTITVNNTGNVPLNNVTVTDTFIGAGVLTFTNSTAYTVNNNGDGTYTITIGNMAKGASVTITATYIVLEADEGKTITNTAAAKAPGLVDTPVEDGETVTVSNQFTLIYNANGGSFGNNEETLTIPNLPADIYILTETQGYTAPTYGKYVLIGWSTTPSGSVIGAGEKIPDCITKVTLSDDNPTQTVYAVWGEDANEDGVADAQQIVIRPADITIYTGGDGYEGVVEDDGGEMVGSSTSHGLPEPGYYLVLPYKLNEDLREDLGVTGTVDLSQHLRFTYRDGRIWELRLYNPNSYSMAYDYYIYQMVAVGTDQDPVRLEIKKDDGTYVTSDDFTIALDTLYQEYEMKLYTVEAAADPDFTVQISVNGEDWKNVAENEANGICPIEGDLTVRGTNSNDPITSIESSVTSPVDVITAEAGDVTYYINDSDIRVVNQDDVALLSDELVGAGVDTLLAEAEDRLGLAWYEDYEYQTQYLDLVDTSNGNAYVTLGAGDSVDIHWPMPNGTSRWNTEFYVVHFDGLDRNFDDLDTRLDSGNVDLQVYTLGNGLRIENGNLVFTTDTFSPFVLIWQDSDRDWPDDDDDDDNDRPSHDDDDDNDRPEQEDPAPELDKESHIAYVSGTPEGTIEPNAYITREEVATIFFRLLTDRSRANYITDYNPFPDVDSSRWSFYPIVTMNNAGIMHGYDDGNFAPSGYITRAEFAVVAAQFSDAEYTGADLFSDISGHWAREYINRAASEGWISGYPDGSFGPDDYITRAQVMALVNEVLDRAPDADYMLDDMITWPDNADESAWYYEDVQEATNSHSYVWRNSGRTSEKWEDLIDTRTLDELVRDAFNGVGISY